jgi:hypothetical protein
MASRPPVNRKDPDAHRARVRKSNRARYRALQELVSRHAAEYDALYEAEALAVGVEPKGRRAAQRAAQEREIAELRGRLAELERMQAKAAS